VIGLYFRYLPFMIKAVSLALREYPMLNSHVDAECTEMVYKAEHNISIAMQTPNGLLVPNVKNCEARSVLEIAEELNRLQTLGAQGMLGPNDLKGGTFALSNIGVVGGTYMTPILVLPQVRRLCASRTLCVVGTQCPGRTSLVCEQSFFLHPAFPVGLRTGECAGRVPERHRLIHCGLARHRWSLGRWVACTRSLGTTLPAKWCQSP
jgi:hypothetical protein